MTTIFAKTAVVTGAGSGLGRALALALLGRGAHVAVADVDEAGLGETARLLRQMERPTRISTHRLDVRSAAGVEDFAAEVEREHGAVDLVFNNAGIAFRAPIASLTYEDLANVLDVNLWGVVHGTKVFLPRLLRRPEAHIVNIGSVNAFVPFPEGAAYNTSKFAVLGWSETLQQELRGTNVRVTCVHPGAVKTNIVRNSPGFSDDDAAYFDRIAKMTGSFVAERVLRAVERNREQVIVGSDARLLTSIKRIAPRWIVKVVGERMGGGRAAHALVSELAATEGANP